MTRIKICGLSRPEDIRAVNEARPDFAGFVIDFPKSFRSVSHQEVRELGRGLRPDIVPVGVFVDAPVDTVAELFASGTIRVAQLHGQEDEGYLAALRRAAPGLTVWKAYTVRSGTDIAAAQGSGADRVLLDNGQGTGETFDWSLVRQVRRAYILAGGLTPENLPAAVAALSPWGVDISSGVETDRVKDPDKIRAAVQAVRGQP